MELPLLDVESGVDGWACEPVGITTFSVAMTSNRKKNQMYRCFQTKRDIQ